MQFDIRTLLVAVALVTAFCAGARILLWRTHVGMPGLSRWAWASVAAALALILIVMRGALPSQLSLSLAQVLMAAGIVLAWDGFRRFLGGPPLSPLLLATLAFGVLVPVVAAQLTQSLLLRSVTNSAFIALVSALIARDLMTAVRPGQLANAVFFLLRAIAAARGVDHVDPWNPDGLAAIPALWWLCMTVATTLGMVLMTSERLQANLDRQASRDPLTGALNRRAFSLLAHKEVGRARRHSQPLSLLMMDLDHFKQINDRLGHGAGDAVLCRFVEVAERMLRGEDVFCRFGGEEFVALLPSTLAERAAVAADRLRAAFAEEAATLLASSHLLPFTITVSVGIGELRPHEDIEGLLRRTDAALYRAKAEGRNRCELASAAGEEPDAVLNGWRPAHQGEH